MPGYDKAKLAALPTAAAREEADGTRWLLKVNDAAGEVWLSQDGKRVRVYSGPEEGGAPVFVREE